MRTTIKLCRVAGIPVGLHWSLLLIGALLAYEVHQGLEEDGSTGPMVWVVALVLVVLFYAGLVAHELGHALIARLAGVGTADITLWMLGGVARLTGDSPSPGTEARMALAGPAVSLLLGLVWGALGWVLDAASAPLLVSDLAWLLAFLNVGLALFNLVPAFPLDGGRVLRALLWHRRGDRLRGTAAAARVGFVLGVGAVAAGLAIAALAEDPLSGAWLALLGAFVIRAGRVESDHVRSQHGGDLWRAGTSCRRPPVLDPATPVAALLAEWPLDAEHHTYLVGAAGRPEGFVVEELLSLLAGSADQTLAEAALPWGAVPVVHASATRHEAVEALQRSRFRRVRVQLPEGDVGVLTAAEVLPVGPPARPRSEVSE